MAIYCIRAGNSGPVKIGFAGNVSRRMTKMQADNHERLSLLRKFVGGRDEEAQLHRRFAHLRLGGEWFSFDEAMLGDLGLREYARETAPRVPKIHPRFVGPLRDALVAAGGVARFAKSVGVNHASIFVWKQIPFEHVAAACGVTGFSPQKLRPDLAELWQLAARAAERAFARPAT